jgi:hypothetical protein
MGNAAAQLADGFQLLGDDKLILNLPQAILSLFSLGNIAGHLGEADEIAAIVINAVDDNGSPKRAAIFADSPALRFKAALLGGLGESPIGDAGLAVLLGVKDAEMLSDNAGRCITLDMLRSRIPGGDMA